MLRKLASIQKINKLEKIDGRDRILKASVLGWETCVKVGEFVEGDLCCWLEIDSVCPEGEAWCEFLRSRKFRVRTCKFANFVSQGLAFPLSTFPELDKNLPIDTDITEQLNVKKYEPKLHDGGAKLGKSAGSFPHFIPRTDELRLQSKPQLLQELYKAGPYYISVKVDGTSSTFCYDDEEFCACSRNWKKKEDETNVYWGVAKRYSISSILKENKNLAIQGEMAGSGIQHNRLRLNGVDLFVFSVFDISKRRYLDFENFIDFCNKYGLRTVPIESVVLGEEICSLSTWIKRAEGVYENTDQQREGIVVRPLKETYSSTLQGRLSFKIINNLYLLSGGE